MRGLVTPVRRDDGQAGHVSVREVLEEPQARAVGGVDVLEEDGQRHRPADVVRDPLELAQPSALRVEDGRTIPRPATKAVTSSGTG